MSKKPLEGTVGPLYDVKLSITGLQQRLSKLKHQEIFCDVVNGFALCRGKRKKNILWVEIRITVVRILIDISQKIYTNIH